MEEKARDILKKMSLQEKAALLGGKDFWSTVEYPEYDIPGMFLADGPCGLRKQEEEVDHLGIHKSVPATACVSGPTLAATWNEDMYEKFGCVIGGEAAVHNVSLLLGPGANIIRSPLCGRNFEYFSEDPYLTGKTASKFIEGVQSQGVGACIKHYAVNNQETEREYIDARIDERTLRENYLTGFEEAVKQAEPVAVMAALNKINGEYGAENHHLLTDILRNEWGYEGFTVSDWFGINEQDKAVSAGMDLEMPFSGNVGTKRRLQAIEEGKLSESQIDTSCARIIENAWRCRKMKETVDRNSIDMEQLSRNNHLQMQHIAEEGIVLLRNENHILPLKADEKVVVIGKYAMEPRFQMEGSARVVPAMVDIPYEMIKKIAGDNVGFASGFADGTGQEPVNEQNLMLQAVTLAEKSDKVVLFIGNPEGIEGEGHDRKKIDLPQNQLELLKAILEVQRNVIIVLSNGSPVSMPWKDQVQGIFECFLGGQAMGGAIANLLYGIVNPSGKLPMTFPKKLEDTPCYFFFPGNKKYVNYSEGVFVGYRYYDKKEIEPLYPFGHGLSYTEFAYNNLVVKKIESEDKLEDNIYINVKAVIKNTGNCAGAEVVQLYVGMFDTTVKKPVKELKGFCKVYLKAGESKEVTFDLKKRAFAFYKEEINDWYVDQGSYNIILACSSKDIRLEEKIEIAPLKIYPPKLTGWSTVGEMRKTPVGEKIYEEMRKIVMENCFMEGIFESFKKETGVNEIPLRIITLATNGIIDNNKMAEYLEKCNKEQFAL